MKLSKHFTLAELTRSRTAERLGIDNSLDPVEDYEIVRNLIELCENVLEPVRKHFGKPIRPTSGYRSPALNKAIGGSNSSQHTLGQAVDFEIAGVSNADIIEFIRSADSGIVYDQLIAEKLRADDPAAGWIHCSYKRDGNRNILISWLGRSGGYVTGLKFVS